MTRDELLTKLRELKPWLEAQGVVNLRLFGSFARDEAGPDSDVDLLVDLTRRMGLEFYGIEVELGDALGRRVEMGTLSELNPFVRPNALRDAIVI